jgi:hypothetical protein
MITSVKQYLTEVGEGKWAKVTPDEEKAIVDSIAGHNLVVAGERGNKHTAYRHYSDRGYIVVHDMGGAAEPHPLDAAK